MLTIFQPRPARPSVPSPAASNRSRLEPLEVRRLLAAATFDSAAYDIGLDGQYDEANAVAVSGDQIVSAGHARQNNAPYLIRLTSSAADGTPTSGFGTGGVVEFPLFDAATHSTQLVHVSDVEVGSNGDIYVAGALRTGWGGGDPVQHLFVQRLNADGTLAAGWQGDSGTGLFSVDSRNNDLRGEGSNFNYATVRPDITVLADGSVLLGSTINAKADDGTTSDTGDDVLVVKFNADGTLASGFGNTTIDGQSAFVGVYDDDYVFPTYNANFNYVQDEEVRGLDVLANGDIALFLEVEGDQFNSQNDRYAAVAMLDASGQRVATFGANGLSVLPGEIEEVTEAQPDGAGGYYLGLNVMQQFPGTSSNLEGGFGALRLDATFAPDATFGTAGTATAQFSASDRPAGIAVDPRGGVVVSGTSESRPVAVRFDETGQSDGDFGDAGRAFAGDAGFVGIFDAAFVGDDQVAVVGFTDQLSGATEVDALLGVTTRTPPEPPEPQTPPITVTYEADSGTLVVVGTEEADDVSITAGATADEVVVSSAGEEVGTFAGVLAIDVDVLAGDDRVVIGDGVLIPATVAGGSGNDFLVGGAGDDAIAGGAGDDVLDGGLGDFDDLFGNDGNDFLFDANGVDDVDGGLGDDTIDLTFSGAWRNEYGYRKSIGAVRGGLGHDLIDVTAEDGSWGLYLIVLGDNLWRGAADGDDTMLFRGDYSWGSIMLPDSILGPGDADYATGDDHLYASHGGVFVFFDCTWEQMNGDDADEAQSGLDDLYAAYNVPPEHQA